MKTIIKNAQGSCIWQVLTTALSVGWVTIVLVISLIFVNPNAPVAAGGCTVPDGECSTIIINS